MFSFFLNLIRALFGRKRSAEQLAKSLVAKYSSGNLSLKQGKYSLK